MVLQEREPVLGGVARPRQPARQIAGHDALRDVEAQLEQFVRAPSQRDNRSEVGAIIYSEVSLIAYSEAGRSRQETETK
jgi:hypothetical protein